MANAIKRMAFIDALKAMASQLIVLHHLSLYGPMSDAAHKFAPNLFSWLAHDARIAVQIFLVIGGFLAAKALAPLGVLTTGNPLSLLKKRYLKLAIPYLAAVLVAILLAALARRMMIDEAIPERPTLMQFLAHVALLQNLLDFDALSAGVWYIAIDFQLFTLMLGTLWLARLAGRDAAAIARATGFVLVAVLIVASLFHFNRDARWDNWALYFFGAYGLGALTYWATESEEQPDWLLLMATVVVIALIVDFRSRIAVAMLTALALGVSRRWGFLENRPQGALVAWLGKISYSVFLIHFPVVLIINGLFVRFAPSGRLAGVAGILVAWLTSIAAGALFHRVVESRASQWQARLIDPLLDSVARVFPALGTRH